MELSAWEFHWGLRVWVHEHPTPPLHVARDTPDALPVVLSKQREEALSSVSTHAGKQTCGALKVFVPPECILTMRHLRVSKHTLRQGSHLEKLTFFTASDLEKPVGADMALDLETSQGVKTHHQTRIIVQCVERRQAKLIKEGKETSFRPCFMLYSNVIPRAALYSLKDY